MTERQVMAIARWVSRDGMDPKMGVLTPGSLDKVDCLLWCQVNGYFDSQEILFGLIIFLDAFCR